MAQEDSYIVMLGGLHMKMTLLKSVGDLLNSSGWVQIPTQADIAMLGTAVIYLKAVHIKKTAYDVGTLIMLMMQASYYLMTAVLHKEL